MPMSREKGSILDPAREMVKVIPMKWLLALMAAFGVNTLAPATFADGFQQDAEELAQYAHTPCPLRQRRISGVARVIHAASVDGYCLGGDKTRPGRREEGNRVRNIVGLTGPSHHGTLAHGREYGSILLFCPALFDQVRQDESGRYGVDGDSMRPKLHGESACQHSDGGFGGGVKRCSRQRGAMRGNGAQIDDAAVPAF